ncbi:unnamed protein product [Brugia timori]|uniref:Ovule protein n=1 Tax=Brugia timori TaxID=42155 RepID=A0A0R3RC52_9BILA|nr:unnamed protein product [Brugia timori]
MLLESSLKPNIHNIIKAQINIVPDKNNKRKKHCNQLQESAVSLPADLHAIEAFWFTTIACSVIQSTRSWAIIILLLIVIIQKHLIHVLNEISFRLVCLLFF